MATIEPAGERRAPTRVNDSEVHRYQDFQVASNGDFAVLASTLPLTGFDTFNRSQVFRYDTDAGIPGLRILRQHRSRADRRRDASPRASTSPTTAASSSPRSNRWCCGTPTTGSTSTSGRKASCELISTGISNFDAGLLGVSADGVNAFFFTRETLAPQDKNGETMKIYDARAGGGFLQIPPLPLCAAKDECHGPGTGRRRRRRSAPSRARAATSSGSSARSRR